MAVHDEMASSKDSNQMADLYVRFVDILFAVVLAQSFTIISSPNGLLLWLSDINQHLLNLGSVFLVYTVVVTSWIGYHTSVAKLPIKSVWRFIIDIILLFLYNFAFMNIASFRTIMIILAAIFFMYLLWVSIRFIEYKSESSRWDIKKRVWQAISFFIVFLVLAVATHLFSNPTADGIILVTAIALLVLYRYVYKGGPKELSSKPNV